MRNGAFLFHCYQRYSTLRRIHILAIAVFVFAAPLPALADGLIYSLPKDGTRVIFEMKGNKSDANSSRDFNGTLSVASVGTATVDGQKCRWIEIVMKMTYNGTDRTNAVKLLITETDLGKGKIPLGNVKRAWHKKAKREAEKFDDVYSRRGRFVPAFLPGPLEDVKTQKAVELQTGIGKLQCGGLTGKTTYEQGDAKRTDRFEVDYELRFSDKVPFGVVTAKITMKEYVRKTRLDDTIVLELKLKTVEKNAKSAIPDKN